MSVTALSGISGCNLYLVRGKGFYDATVAGNAVTTDRAAEARWEDQVGTNHVTQATSDNQCRLDAITGACVSECGANQKWAMPGGYSYDRRAFTALFLVELATLRRNYYSPDASFPAFSWFLIDGSGASFGLYYDPTNSFKLSLFDGGVHNSTLAPPTSLCLIGFVCDSSGVTVYVDDQSSALPALAAGTATGGYLLGNSAIQPLHAAVHEVAFYNRALNSSEMADAVAYARTVGVPTSDYGTVLALDGDSITYGYGTTCNRSFGRQITSAANLRRFCTAEASITLQTLLSQRAARVDPLIVAGKKNILVCFAATNDIVNNGRTAAEVFADKQSYGSAAIAAGWSRVVFVGMLPRGASYEPPRQTLRASMLAAFPTRVAPGVYRAAAGTAFGHYYVDVDAIGVIGGAGANSDATVYLDGVHLNTLGHGLLARAVMDAVRLAEADGPRVSRILTGGGM